VRIETVREVGPRLGIAPTCAALGLPTATYYRRIRPQPLRGSRPSPPRTLAGAERTAVLAGSASKWLFPSARDSALHTGNADRTWRRFKKQLEREKVPALRIHDCRHSYAMLALKSGVSIVWLSNQLGHSKTSITLDVYAHAIPREARDLGFADFGRHQTSPVLRVGSSEI
jgi:integrase